MIIVSQPRSGTHMVRTALNKHPRIRIASEIFNGLHGSLHTTLKTMPANFCLHAYDPEDLVGIWPEWQKQAAFQANMHAAAQQYIILQRRNKLDQAISYFEALHYGYFHRMQIDPEQHADNITIKPGLLVAVMKIFIRSDVWISSNVHGRVFYYEDIADEISPVLEEAQQLLNVSPQKLTPQTKKLGTREMHTRVKNWEQICESLVDTEFEQYIKR